MSKIYLDDEELVIDNRKFESLFGFGKLFNSAKTKMAIISNDNKTLLTPLQEISEYTKSDNSSYTTFEELETVLDGFFLNVVSGATVKEDHIFDTTTERDSYFSDNLDELFAGLNIIVDGVLYVWVDSTNPDIYDNTYWHDYTEPITAATVKALYESNSDTEALQTAKKTILDKLSTNENGQTVSTNAWVFPPNTVYIGLNAQLSNALRALNLYDPILDKRGLMVAQLYDDTGSSQAFAYDIAAKTSITENDQTGETLDSTQFIRTPVSDEIINGLEVYTSAINTEITTNLIIRLTSHEGTIVYNVTKSVTTDSNGMAIIELNNPIVTDSGLDLYVEMNIPDMIGSYIDGEFVPKHNVYVQKLSRKDLATEEYVDEERGKIAAGYCTDKISKYCYSEDTFYKIDIPFTVINTDGFSFDSTLKRWIYTDSKSRSFSILANWTGSHDDDSSKTVSWTFYKNGVAIPCASKSKKIYSGSTADLNIIIPSVTLCRDDYIEMYVSIDDPRDVAYTEEINILIK